MYNIKRGSLERGTTSKRRHSLSQAAIEVNKVSSILVLVCCYGTLNHRECLFFVSLLGFYGNLILVLYLFIYFRGHQFRFFLMQFFHDFDGWCFRDVNNIEYEQSKTRLKLCRPNAFEALRCSGQDHGTPQFNGIRAQVQGRFKCYTQCVGV